MMAGKPSRFEIFKKRPSNVLGGNPASASRKLL
jgi:hypothetical protein